MFLVGPDGKVRDRVRGHRLGRRARRGGRPARVSAVSGVFRPGKRPGWGRGSAPGARSRSAVSRAAAGCCACSARSARRRQAGDPRGRAGRSGSRSRSSARPSSSSGSCSRRVPTSCRTSTSRSWASSSTTCRRSRSRRLAGSSTRTSASTIFARLDEQPLACASIAQVHGALLRTGREVVVKVRRPGIEEQVALDLELLRSLTSFAEGRSRDGSAGAAAGARGRARGASHRRARLRRGGARLRADRAASWPSTSTWSCRT